MSDPCSTRDFTLENDFFENYKKKIFWDRKTPGLPISGTNIVYTLNFIEW
jgi:hypothetical protein